MGDPPIDLTKLLPESVLERAYEDAISPAGQQVGHLSEDFLKSIRLFLAPIQLLASYQDRLENFLKKSVNKVDEERRIQAPAEIAGPIFERLKYIDVESEIAEMFSNLLASSIDKNTSDSLHPSFVSMLGQIDASEARLLKALFPYGFNLKLHGIHGKVGERLKRTAAALKFENYHQLIACLSHLESLGIVSLRYDNVTSRKRIVAYLYKTVRSIDFSPFGLRFMKACLRSGPLPLDVRNNILGQ